MTLTAEIREVPAKTGFLLTTIILRFRSRFHPRSPTLIRLYSS